MNQDTGKFISILMVGITICLLIGVVIGSIKWQTKKTEQQKIEESENKARIDEMNQIITTAQERIARYNKAIADENIRGMQAVAVRDELIAMNKAAEAKLAVDPATLEETTIREKLTEEETAEITEEMMKATLETEPNI